MRRCIATGAVLAKPELLRFVAAPDGTVVPDIAERLPGRGLWLTARRDIVALAVAKRLFGRAARASVTVPGDLAERVEALLRERCAALLGLARRAGVAVSGFEKVREAIGAGKAALLVVASDGGESGREKVGALAGDLPLVTVLTAAELGAVFARDRVVHVALARSGIVREVAAAALRLARYREPSPPAVPRGVKGGGVRGRGGRSGGAAATKATVPERNDG